MSSLLTSLTNFLENISQKKLIFLLLAISIVKTGIWYHPLLWHMLEIAKNPFENVFGNEAHKYFLYSSWLGPFIGYMLNFTSKSSFFILHLLFSIFFLISFILLIKDRVEKNNQRTSIILFFVFPVSMISLYWVGYDSLLLLLFTISVYFHKNLLVTLLCSIGIGLQHFEIGIVSTGLLLTCKIIEELSNKDKQKIDISYIFLLIYFFGLITGKIILYYIYVDENLVGGRFSWAYNALLHLVYNFYFNFYNIAWFSLGVGWLVIFKFFFDYKNQYPLIISLLLLLFTVMPLVDDHTRIYSASSFIIIIYYIICNNNFLKTINKNEQAIIFVIWVLFPYSWIWQGDPRASMFQYDLAYLINFFFDVFNNHVDSSTIWPFERIKLDLKKFEIF